MQSDPYQRRSMTTKAQPKNKQNSRLLGIHQVADLLGVTITVARDMFAREEIPNGRKMGNRWVIDRELFDDWYNKTFRS